MPNRQPQRKHFIGFLASILIFSLVLMTVNVRYEKSNLFFESIVVWFFSPIQNLLTSTTSYVSDAFDHYFFLVETSKENDRLLLKVNLLSKKNNELIERNKLLERSDNLIEFLDKDERPFVIAKVIGYDATQWSKVIFINRGTNHKVQKNSSVMNNAGVIGHVIHSSPNSSKVLLITDGRSAVDSLFQETRESGITVGTGENICEMKFVPISAKINLGDKVISSGLGGVFPKGLVVGRVVDIVKQSQELFQDIMVEPSADLSNIEEVIVLLPNQVE
ncbi:MAG: rod shape-determining protein MreC [Nitrospina sp.]|nr:rod shape-determining protein MreC [Nitrospina sp.]MBT6296622.1 rod shape-determining protein MreC [Nitrospina sp.]MBT6662970.1 rod shape-determining protein MreC [Nitrospina sp.]